MSPPKQVSATGQPGGPLSLVKRSHPIVSMVGYMSSFLLQRWCASVQVRGLDSFLQLLEEDARVCSKRRRGIVTYANHISVMDDPTLFGALPPRTWKNQHTTRWTLGASDIMFTNSFFSRYFSAGQVLATDRGRGVFQPSIDRSLDLLESGGWIHIFPEGYVNMSREARVRRFKWGIGRILLESSLPNFGYKQPVCPYVIPIWITGLDRMMPEPRRAPRWLPRPGANVSITIGRPINQMLEPVLLRLHDFLVQPLDDIPTHESLVKFMTDVSILSPTYPPAASSFFSKRTPLQGPPEGVPWPVPLPESRSALAIAHGADDQRARLARSMVSAELRAHLVKLGEESGMDHNLAHQLMKDDLDGSEH